MDALAALSALCGWVYTLAWSLSFYPQPLLNVRRRSTHGTTVDFPFLNCIGFLAYLLSNVALSYSPTVRREYANRHHGLTPAVAVNDIAFAAHALVLSLVTTSQYFLPGLWGMSGVGGAGVAGERPRLVRPSHFILGLTAACVAGVAGVVALAATAGGGEGSGVTAATSLASPWGWLDVVYALGYVKLVVTLVKYSPQVLTNYRLRSTAGWSIWTILLDVIGGVLSIAQLILDSLRQGDWSGVTGNPVKLLLGNVSMAYDLVFIVQHYVLYWGVDDVSPGERSALLG